MLRIDRLAACIVLAIVLSGCTTLARTGAVDDRQVVDAELSPPTFVQMRNINLAPPRAPLDVAVYSFGDLTGQNKPSEGFSNLSRAVTQGGDAILIEALKQAGSGRWFRVVERSALQELLQERNIIEQMRTQYEGRSRTLPALRYAGLLITGGIVGYDTNQLTGGMGARFLGIGAKQEYRQDIITVTLRTVSVNTGEVLSSQTTTKTAYSVQRQGNLFEVVTPINNGEILELEAGYTQNEPVSLAVRQAIEFAVYTMIIEGARNGHWSFADPAAQQAAIAEFDRRYRALTNAQAVAYQRKAGL